MSYFYFLVQKGVAEKIEELGGMVVKDVASDLLCFIATKGSYKSCSVFLVLKILLLNSVEKL